MRVFNKHGRPSLGGALSLIVSKTRDITLQIHDPMHLYAAHKTADISCETWKGIQMPKNNVVILGALLVVSGFQPALADTGHGHDAKTEMDTSTDMTTDTGQMGMMDDDQMGMMADKQMSMDMDMMEMMARMMQMHRAMMVGQNAMGMMGQGMMPGSDQQALGPDMEVNLQEYDADGDGSLTLEEFEALHMQTLREQMVDRFQDLDADGDGQVSQEEITQAEQRTSTMQAMNSGSGSDGHHGEN